MPRKQATTPASDFLFVHPGLDLSAIGGAAAQFPDAALWLLSILYHKKVIRRRKRTEFVNLHSDLLAMVMGNAGIVAKVWRCLEEAGLIVCDRDRTYDVKSYGYRFADGVDLRGWQRVRVEGQVFRNRVRKFRERINKRPEGAPAVIGHLGEYVDRTKFGDDLEQTIADLPDVDYSADADFANKKELAAHQVAVFQSGYHWLVADECGRVHTPFTSMCGELRSSLEVGGERLCEIDMVNSQPYLAACLACERYTQGTTGQGGTRPGPGHIPYNLGIVPEDLRRMLDRACSGLFYDDFVVGDDWTRDEVKEILIRPIFGKVYQMETELGGEWLRERYPTWVDLAIDMKRNNDRPKHKHKYFGRLLQSMESDAIIHGACERLRRDFPQVPILTVHDSILTPERYVDLVKGIMLDAFARYPAPPKLKVKYAS